MTSLSGYRTLGALKTALCLQGIIMPLVAFLFDNAWHMLLFCGTALVAFWSMVLFVGIRRAGGFSLKDLSLIRWGLFPILIIVWVAMCFVRTAILTVGGYR